MNRRRWPQSRSIKHALLLEGEPRDSGYQLVVVAVIASCAIGIWLPQPARGLLCGVAAFAGPTWSIAVLLLAAGIERTLAAAAGVIATLASWSLATLAILAVGLPINRLSMLALLSTLVAVPWLAARYVERRMAQVNSTFSAS